MSQKYFVFFLLLFFPVLTACGNGVYIRVNQVGFLPGDVKTALILSGKDLEGESFFIKDANGKTESSGKLGANSGAYGDFRYSYFVDFSELRLIGSYRIHAENRVSPEFKIGFNVYEEAVVNLLKFFEVQRCGYTDPKMHEVCHIADVTSLIRNGRSLDRQADVTGGWHDAADYIKFFNTTAYSTYLLLFAYDFAPERFSFDKNNNGAPDILEEARIGLDWLLRADYRENEFITQVQDLRDHEVGWRMPSEDSLSFDRPGFTGIGKNLVGLYSATMALGSKIWKERFSDLEFSSKMLNAAEQKYGIRESVQDIDSSGTGEYLDNKYLGKLALGAAELYNVTGKSEYFDDAKNYAGEAGSDFWWSWGNINSLAHYRIAQIEPEYAVYIENNLKRFKEISVAHVFGNGVEFTWGSNHTLLGITLQNILWKTVTGRDDYDTLSVLQRDYILGRNPWGISFISGTGEVYSDDLHHQVAYFKGRLPGGFAAGPVQKKLYDDYNIELSEHPELEKFQSEEAVYYDDRMDYLTNEPTISANAAAIFVMGYFKE